MSLWRIQSLFVTMCQVILPWEEVMEEEEFESARLLLLGPYSAPLNPIEEVWNVFKAHMKSALAQKMTELLTTAPSAGTTLMAHRLQFLERIIDSNIHHVSLGFYLKAINHAQKHFRACLQKVDLRMGDISAASFSIA